MPNVTRGSDIAGLLGYLVGPGRHNEHTDPHLVAGDPAILAWHDDTELSRAAAADIARALDEPRRLLAVEVPDGDVWHCSLSLKAEEGRIGDARWAAIATDFVEGMGFTTPTDDAAGAGAVVGRANCRWVAVHHGVSTAGNDHIHLVVSLVREDGTKANVWRDRVKVQALAGELEAKYGLQVLESRQHARGDRGVTPAELAKADRTGAPEPERVALARLVRGCAVAATDEAEFVRRMRTSGLIVRSRLAAGTDSVVVGYSVATRPGAGERPIWFGGGTLARDLTLPRLRAGWPDTPDTATAAAAEWAAARRGRRPVAPGREVADIPPAEWGKASAELRALQAQLRGVPVTDRATWARLATDASGAFAAWSARVEATPGPLAAAADALASAGQIRAHELPARPTPGPSVKATALLLASIAHGGQGTVAHTVMLRQLTRTCAALIDAHTAAGEARRAQALAAAVRDRLEEVRAALPPLPQQAAAGTATAVRERTAPPVRAPGSVLPADLERARRTTPTHGHPGRGNEVER